MRLEGIVLDGVTAGSGMIWFAFFFALGAAGTAVARGYARHRNLVDLPGERRSHSTPTPRGGGVSIVAALMVAMFVLALRGTPQVAALLAMAIGLAMVAGIGMIDDHRPLSPWLRLSVHAVAATLLGLAIADSAQSPLAGLFAFALAMALTNVWNFMDGINGIAASQAALVAGLLAGWQAGAWSALALALVAACLGFLPFNFPRARIFLGDVGSGAIGFALAGLLALVIRLPDSGADLLLLLPLSAFLVDAGLTLLRRAVRGERWWTAHAQHAYQVWARRSGHAWVTVAYAAWTLAAVALAASLGNASQTFILKITVAWYTTAAVAWGVLQALDPNKSAGKRQPQKDGE
ncbi:MraY family glycosyltransferase [Montanilutibacter psychrotolerans]|uniref:Glycosyltransferase family 4 protein n=1 Tax=Montanilutibacter psychrotolerans TaxID=1327343 RepID=A0A3M8T1G3_9GAMM|nr:glycosyltransferase family 4 protein [Lysobacter psychrotolerans]RNF85354.1 glycosyltransferase family 4 protein [Lysobacter psychrotolerans]